MAFLRSNAALRFPKTTDEAETVRILSINSSLGSQVALLELPGTLEDLRAQAAASDTAVAEDSASAAPAVAAQSTDDLLSELTVLAEVSQSNSRAHAESLGPMMEEALAVTPGELDLIVASTGPAPFTGLRAGLVSARVMARARRISIVGVPSLESVARRAFDELLSDAELSRPVVSSPSAASTQSESAGPLSAKGEQGSAAATSEQSSLEIQVATDARRKEVYTCRLRARGAHDVEALSEIEVLSPATLVERLATDGVQAVAGSGISLYPELAQGRTVLAPISGDAVAQARIALARLAAGRVPEDMPTEPLYLRYADVHMPQGKKS